MSGKLVGMFSWENFRAGASFDCVCDDYADFTRNLAECDDADVIYTGAETLLRFDLWLAGDKEAAMDMDY